MLSNRSDNEVIEAIKSSDVDAFKVLYDRYHKSLFNFLWRRIRNHEVSKDLLQELFIRIWKNRMNLDSGRSITAYLYRIAHNLTIDHLRKKSVAQDYLADISDEDMSFEEERFDLSDTILNTIHALPTPLQQVFTLNRFEGLKYREIADVLNVSIKTVESRMSKALRILREKLAPFLTSMIILNFFLQS